MDTLSIDELISRISQLRAGESYLLSGIIYTARDAAHKRLAQMITADQSLPFRLENAVIYYCGPCPAAPGQVIGSCGPTTSSRMDVYTPLMYSQGVKATIGKGPRAQTVADALNAYRAVYLIATGGIGALLSRCVKKMSVVAFEDLGPEAVYRLEIKDFPVTVAMDSAGGSIFDRSKA